jgi:hypothetical protein
MPEHLDSMIRMEADEPQVDSSSLLQVATVLFRYRWGGLTFIILGALAALVELKDHLPLQTTGTVRFATAGVTYGNRPFWDLVQKTRVTQLRALAVTESMPVNIRTVTDPWFLTIEVQHRKPGEGREVLDRLLQQLPEYGDAMGVSGNGASGPGVRQELLAQWQSALERAESVLQKLVVTAETREAGPNEPPWRQTELPSISGPGTPLSLLPFSPWLQHIQRETSRYFAARAGQGNASFSTEEAQLRSSLDEAMMLMLRYRGALDLTAAYQAVVETTLDIVTEVPRPMLGEAIQKLMVGGWLGGLLGALVFVPLHWLRSNWTAISAGLVKAE